MKEDVEELFPQLSDEANDQQLDNLIKDIHAYRFVKGFWDVQKNDNKKKMKAGVSLEAEQPTKKQKKDKKQKEINSSEDEDVDVEKKKKQKEVGECKGKGCQRGERQG